MARNWFTADCHFGHANIVKYCKRPYKTVQEMNEVLIVKWNSRVKEGDTVFHNGDFCFKNSSGGKPGEGMLYKSTHWSEKLNGNIIYVAGNHDKNNSTKTLIHKVVIKYGHHYINIVHDPKHFDNRFELNFVGHVHNHWKFRRVLNAWNDTYTDLINVGVDVWDFQPISFEEIYSSYRYWTKHIKAEEIIQGD